MTLGIVTFLATWNDFIWPLDRPDRRARYTLPVALASLVGEHVQDTELMMAGSVLTVLPVLLLFLLLQRTTSRASRSGASRSETRSGAQPG